MTKLSAVDLVRQKYGRRFDGDLAAIARTFPNNHWQRDTERSGFPPVISAATWRLLDAAAAELADMPGATPTGESDACGYGIYEVNE